MTWEKKVGTMDQVVQSLSEKVNKLEETAKNDSKLINKLERMTRRNNLRFVGIAKSDGEDCQKLIRELVASKFEDVGDISIERAHRDGRGTNGRAPHILVRFLSFQTKLSILRQARRVLEGEAFFVLDDLTGIDLQEKKRWAKRVKELYDQGTKLRFSGGLWRDSSGRPYAFTNT